MLVKLERKQAYNILQGKVEDVEFCLLKEVALTLGMKDPKLRYNCIKVMLALKHKTGRELASFLDIHPQTIVSWTTNIRQPRLDELYAIAAFLRIDPSELLS